MSMHAQPRMHYSPRTLTWWCTEGGYANYVVDDFGSLVRLPFEADHRRLFYTQDASGIGQAEVRHMEAREKLDDAMSALWRSQRRVDEARAAVLAALPPAAGAAQ